MFRIRKNIVDHLRRGFSVSEYHINRISATKLAGFAAPKTVPKTVKKDVDLKTSSIIFIQKSKSQSSKQKREGRLSRLLLSRAEATSISGLAENPKA